MDIHDKPRDVAVNLTPTELDVPCSALPQAERLLQKNSRLKRGTKPKRLMMEVLSAPNDGRLGERQAPTWYQTKAVDDGGPECSQWRKPATPGGVHLQQQGHLAVSVAIV